MPQGKATAVGTGCWKWRVGGSSRDLGEWGGAPGSLSQAWRQVPGCVGEDPKPGIGPLSQGPTECPAGCWASGRGRAPSLPLLMRVHRHTQVLGKQGGTVTAEFWWGGGRVTALKTEGSGVLSPPECWWPGIVFGVCGIIRAAFSFYFSRMSTFQQGARQRRQEWSNVQRKGPPMEIGDEGHSVGTSGAVGARSWEGEDKEETELILSVLLGVPWTKKVPGKWRAGAGGGEATSSELRVRTWKTTRRGLHVSPRQLEVLGSSCLCSGRKGKKSA